MLLSHHGINYEVHYKTSTSYNQVNKTNVTLTRLEMELAEEGLPYKASSLGILTCRHKHSSK